MDSLFNKIWHIIEKPFGIIGSLCSILSIVVICVVDKDAAWWALGALCVSLLLFLIALLRVLDKLLEKNSNKEDHVCISSFVNYKTEDGDNIEFESYKLIQVKCAVMQFFNVGYKWSGRYQPDCSSDLQDIELTKSSEDSNCYDNAKLRLKTPALYNQTTVIHFKARMNDVDKVSEPKVELCVKYPIEYIQITVSLGYKASDYNAPAVLKRIKLNSDLPSDYTNVDSVPFDPIHKQYQYRLINPEPGYFYKLVWER